MYGAVKARLRKPGTLNLYLSVACCVTKNRPSSFILLKGIPLLRKLLSVNSGS